ncbi:MAG: hypothetical protein AB8B56_04420 [Crocinitomicaceae bacterium]
MIVEPTNTRELTDKEIGKMRRKHLVLIPVILIAGLILWVITQFDTLPEVARWAGMAIASLVILIFISKHVKMERDLRQGLVHVVRGEITKKRKFGGNRKTSAKGTSRASGSRRSRATYFIYIDERKFTVPPKIYSKVKEGNQVEMNYFPKSQFYLGIEVLKDSI